MKGIGTIRSENERAAKAARGGAAAHGGTAPGRRLDRMLKSLGAPFAWPSFASMTSEDLLRLYKDAVEIANKVPHEESWVVPFVERFYGWLAKAGPGAWRWFWPEGNLFLASDVFAFDKPLKIAVVVRYTPRCVVVRKWIDRERRWTREKRIHPLCLHGEPKDGAELRRAQAALPIKRRRG